MISICISKTVCFDERTVSFADSHFIMDSRFSKLADVLTQHSINLQKGEKVLIDVCDIPEGMVIATIRSVRARGGIPFVNLGSGRIQRELLTALDRGQYDAQMVWQLEQMKAMDAYIGIRGAGNIYELSDVPPDNMTQASRSMKAVLEQRVNQTKWVILRWPTSSMAQQALMSSEAFEDFFFQVCTYDYAKMETGMRRLEAMMQSTDRVELKGPELDLRFSIKDIGAVACGGRHNIPDGEVFSCPILDSVEGSITFNTPSVYRGSSFDQVHLGFKKGKIVEAQANDTEALKAILDSDPGARYIGEFAIGFNPLITEPMRDILFDEKIAGSFHFTPGQAYEEADNGNRSQVHWDMVHIQRPEYGGGSIYFDGELIRKDGLFVQESLQCLNPEHLLN